MRRFYDETNMGIEVVDKHSRMQKDGLLSALIISQTV